MILNCNVTGTGGDRADLRGIRFTVNQSFVAVEVRMAGGVAGSYGFTAELRRSTGFTAAVEASVPMSETMPTLVDTPFKTIHIDFPSTIDVTGSETFTLKFSSISGRDRLYIEQTGFDNLPCAGVEETNENNVASPTERSDPAGFKVLALAAGQCGNLGDRFEEHQQATASFIPASGIAGSQFEVNLRDVDKNAFGDEPAEAYWDDFINGAALPQGVNYGSLIGQGTIPQGETITAFNATVPSDATKGQHAVTVCWRLNLQETWYYKQANFDVDSGPSTPTPTATPTPTPTPTPPPTPTPAATPLPFYAFLPLPDLLPVVFPSFPNPDLSIHGIEITQAVQCFDTSNGLGGCPNNSLPVVAQKHTTARIYPRYSGPFTQMAGVPVRLHIFANGVEYIANTFGTAKTFIDQANNDNANVWFNANFTNDINVSFYAEVDPENVIAETNESNNRFPASGTISKTFERRDTEKVVGWRMRYHPPGFTGNQYAGGWAVNGGGADYLEDAWPVKSNNGVPYSVKSGYYNRTTVVTEGNTGAILDGVTSQWVMQNWFSWLFGTGAFTGADQVFVWTPRDFFVRGLSDPAFAGGLGIAVIGDDSPGTSIDDPGFGAVNFAHEVTHNQNVKHTGTGVGCDDSGASNPPWPYSNAKIQEFGYNPDTGKIFDPASSYDFMSYCYGGNLNDDAWISPFHWNRVFNSVPASLGGVFPQGLQPTSSEKSLVVNATIDNPDINGDEGGQLGDLHLADVSLEILPPPGDYAIELRDGGDVLLSQSFDVGFEPVQGIGISGDPFPPLGPRTEVMVSFIMPWADGATSIALVNNGTTLDEFVPSVNAPTVSFTSPAGPEAWPAGSTQTLSWEGSDIDGDDLTYSLAYSVDGIEWEIIDAGLTGTSYQIETDSLAGAAAATFRVVATDGINIGSDETPPITVPNKAPMVAITDPAPGTVITPGGLSLFNATAVDLEDDDLPDDAFSWSSNVDGDLGSGASLPINTLSNGPHTVTLTVEDSDGASSTATVVVLVAVPAFVDVIPDVISPAGSPPNVTAIVILPFGYPTDTLDQGSLQMIIGTATLDPTAVEILGDTDSDGLIELQLTFDGAAVQSALPGGIGPASARIVGETDGGISVQGSDTISQVSAGDANCDGSINPVDSLTVLRYDAGLSVTPTEDCILATADVNCDGEVNPVDSLGILRFDAGLSVNQPGDCPLLGTPPIVAAVDSDTEDSAPSRGFPALPPIAWFGLAFVLPALVLTARRRY